MERQNRGGGVLIGIKRNIPFNQLPELKLTYLENIGIEITLNDNKTKIYSAYHLPNKAIIEGYFEKILEGNVPIIMMGDLNCKNLLRNSSKTTTMGKALQHIYDKLNNTTIIGPKTQLTFSSKEGQEMS